MSSQIEFESLLTAAQSGEASEEQLAELNELLRSKPELRELAAERLLLDSLLLEHHEGIDGASEHDLLTSDTLFPQTSVERSVSARTLVTSPLFWGVSVAVATVLTIVVGLAQNYLDQPIAENPLTVATTNSQLLATVTLSHDAQWQPSKSLGDHISAGAVELLSGVGRIHTLRGTELLIDARSKPARMVFASDGTVNVDEGHVVVSVTEAEMGFKIRTPTTSIVDIGTRFEIDVSPAGQSEVQVIDGAVTCLPLDAVAIKNESLLSAGQASVFSGPQDQAGVAVKEPVSHYADLESIRDGLDYPRPGEKWFQEGFGYPSGLLPTESTGDGWLGGWHAHTDHTKPPVALVRSDGMLTGIPWVRRSSPSYCVLPNASVSARQLAEPISLAQDRVLYASWLMRKQRLAPLGTRATGSGFTLMKTETAEESANQLKPENIAFGLSFDHRDHLTASTGSGRYNAIAPVRMDVDRVYFVVVKLDLRKDEPDCLYAKVFTDRDPPRVTEPSEWDSIAPAYRHDGYLRKIHLWSNQNAITAFDELRLGETWASVVPLHR
ncbi:MAG: FecR family protein [Planctomycetota bacterium]